MKNKNVCKKCGTHFARNCKAKVILYKNHCPGCFYTLVIEKIPESPSRDGWTNLLKKKVLTTDSCKKECCGCFVKCITLGV